METSDSVISGREELNVKNSEDIVLIIQIP